MSESVCECMCVRVGPVKSGRFFLAFMIRCPCFSVASLSLSSFFLTKKREGRGMRGNERQKIPPSNPKILKMNGNYITLSLVWAYSFPDTDIYE